MLKPKCPATMNELRTRRERREGKFLQRGVHRLKGLLELELTAMRHDYGMHETNIIDPISVTHYSCPEQIMSEREENCEDDQVKITLARYQDHTCQYNGHYGQCRIKNESHISYRTGEA